MSVDPFNIFARQLNIPLLLLTPAGALVDANPAAARELACSMREIGTVFAGMLETSAGIKDYLARCNGSCAPLPGRLERQWDGKLRTYRCEASRFRGSEDPRVLLRFWTPRDDVIVSTLRRKVATLHAEKRRRMEAEAQLKRRDTEYRRLVEGGLLGVFHSRLSGEIDDANDRALEIIGYDRDDLRARRLRWPEITAPEYAQSDARAVADLRRHGRTRLYEKQYVRRDGSRIPVLIGVAMLEDGTDRTVAFVLDISGQKAAEAEREALVQRLEHNLDLNRTFLSILGHDLRTPLAAVRMNAQLLAKRDADAQDREIVQRIISSTERMSRMIEQLVDASRAGMGGGIPVDRREVDFARVCGDIVSETKSANPDCDIRFAVAGDCSGLWDPDRLAQAVSNLVDNAVHHGEPDAPVRVVLNGVSTRQVEFAVSNRGRIPPELLPVLFKPFERLSQGHRGRRGLGLGLFIAQEIIQRHGGNVRVETGDDTTTFVARIPRRAA